MVAVQVSPNILSLVIGCSNIIHTKSSTLHCTAAGSAVEVEVKDQQIQTEITETEDQHVHVGSTVLHQGTYARVYCLAFDPGLLHPDLISQR